MILLAYLLVCFIFKGNHGHYLWRKRQLTVIHYLWIDDGIVHYIASVSQYFQFLCALFCMIVPVNHVILHNIQLLRHTLNNLSESIQRATENISFAAFISVCRIITRFHANGYLATLGSLVVTSFRRCCCRLFDWLVCFKGEKFSKIGVMMKRDILNSTLHVTYYILNCILHGVILLCTTFYQAVLLCLH